MNKKFLLITTAIASLALIPSCSSLDVVGKDSIRAFGDILNIIKPREVNSKWMISAPDGGAHFLWNGSRAVLKIDAKPFIDAGLDTSRYPGIDVVDGEVFIIISNNDNGNGASSDHPKTTPLDDYKSLVNANRKLINFHIELDHYGVDLDGNMFEWAKDLRVNGKTGKEQNLDMVFVLDPKPLLAAGVVPKQVEEWVLAPVEMMGTTTDKFLKPFDLM